MRLCPLSPNTCDVYIQIPFFRDSIQLHIRGAGGAGAGRLQRKGGVGWGGVEREIYFVLPLIIKAPREIRMCNYR